MLSISSCWTVRNGTGCFLGLTNLSENGILGLRKNSSRVIWVKRKSCSVVLQNICPKLFSNSKMYAKRGHHFTRTEIKTSKKKYKNEHTYFRFKSAASKLPHLDDSDSSDVEMVEPHPPAAAAQPSGLKSDGSLDQSKVHLSLPTSNFRAEQCELSSLLEDPATDDERLCWNKSIIGRDFLPPDVRA